MPTGHYKFRASFGVVTRLFRGARYGDPFDPKGPQYFTEGRVLDYSTDVGPFTIVDQSDEGNTATLYSGRGISTDGVNDWFDIPAVSPLGNGIATATVWIKAAAGTEIRVTFTDNQFQTLDNVWEKHTFTYANWRNIAFGTDNGANSTLASWSDLVVTDDEGNSAHYTLADWSDITADGLNGKTIVDSGPNQLHGTCTGCAGFTGEGIDPEVAGIVGLDAHPWLDGASEYINKSTDLPISNTSEGFDIEFDILAHETSYRFFAFNNSPNYRFELVGTQLSVWVGGGTAGVTRAFFNIGGLLAPSVSQTFRFTYDGSSVVSLYLNGSLFGSMALTGAVNLAVTDIRIGSAASGTFTGLIKNLTFGSWIATGAGVESSDWGGAAVVGSPVTVGQKRATIPQTGAVNWNKYDWNGGSPILSATGDQLVSASDANDQIDAYGNAIDQPRTNAQVVNIFGDGELVKTLAAASLDTIKTVSGWIWHDGTARTVIDLGTPTVGTTATDLTSSGFTGVTYFVNGASGATLSAGWNHCIVASTVALATDDIDILAKSGSSIDYITTLTVAEALQNFDAQKALYNI